MTRPGPRPATGLTVRERQVLLLRARGKPTKAVAAELGISDQTAKNISLMACRKLGAMGLIEAMNALGWVTIPDERTEVR